jgi:Uma2 family endonuclease
MEVFMLHEEMMTLDIVAAGLPRGDTLPTEDGEPLETPWHRAEINLLIESLDYHWRDRTDYYTGGNMFIYFSLEQVRNRDYRGPDFYVVKDVDGTKERGSWVVWEEGGRYPDLIIELLSPSTAETDKTKKKRLYEQVFHTPEYYCYDPTTQELLGWHLQGLRYRSIRPNQDGRLWSEVLELEIGLWEGSYIGKPATWLRFFDEQGQVIPTFSEAETIRADEEAAARLALEAELAQAQEELARLRGE